MRYIFALAMIAGLGASGVALAGNDGQGREADARERAMSTADMTAKFDELGYDVRHLASDGRYYKAYMVDRESGDAVKVKLDRASGDLVGAKLAQGGHDDRETHDRKATREHRETREHETGRDRDHMKEHRESPDRDHRDSDD